MKRAIVIVLDSVGCGASPDSYLYGDEGSNTLNHIAENFPPLELPNLQIAGLGRLPELPSLENRSPASGAFGRMSEISSGKDTTTGHWELSGLILKSAFPTYPDGFPSDLINKFEQAIGTRVIGNLAASGTEIIARLGDEHVATGFPIVYTSADSVFQIAAHEDIISIEKLYKICEQARSLLTGEHAVGRVIARPFTGKSGSYARTPRRHDFSLEPTGETMLDRVKAAGLEVRAVGKIHDIFAGRGTTWTTSTKSNAEGINLTINQLNQNFNGLLFVNLVDFDSLYGHRNDVAGYARALMEFDRRLPDIRNAMKPDDLLFITADHGCDPVFPGTDHTREYVPLLISGHSVKPDTDLGTIRGFGAVAATATQYLGLDYKDFGTSVLGLI